jgi:putative oxidoreductase
LEKNVKTNPVTSVISRAGLRRVENFSKQPSGVPEVVVPQPRPPVGAVVDGPASRRAAAGDRFRATMFPMIDRAAPAALRLSLAAVYLWFGLLKLLGQSPVEALVSSTLPLGDPGTTVRVLGAVEVALGVGLLIGRARRLLLMAVIAHLCGTFLTVLMAPGLLFQHRNPLLLTADGEFVLKNLVLITATLLLVTATRTKTLLR